MDDGSAALSLPEAPLLGVLPGTGGLTRLTDKRRVRRDRADVFATKAEGIKGRTAVDWGLADEVIGKSKFGETVAQRARQAAAASPRAARAGAARGRAHPARPVDHRGRDLLPARPAPTWTGRPGWSRSRWPGPTAVLPATRTRPGPASGRWR